jgi:uncharacterized Zn-finger protein
VKFVTKKSSISKSLDSTHPELAKEAVDWDPSEYTFGSHTKKLWRCEKNHQYLSIIKNRVKGDGCPYCTNRKVLSGYNDLATTHPELAKEANGWDPTSVIAGTPKKLEWKCKNNHIWSANGQNRSRGAGCPYCNNKYVKKNYNDLATTHPHLAKEANGWDPTTVFAGTHKSLEWKCSKGHIWKAKSISRFNGNNCPYCSGRYPFVGETDLATTHPHLVNEAYGWDPTTISAGTQKSLEWKCSKGHIWKARPLRRIAGDGCSVCSNHQALIGYNDLATTHPEIAKQAYGWDPTTVIAGTRKKLEWKCESGHIWITTGDARTSGRNCIYCSHQKVLAGFNDLATTHPDLAKEAYGWDPRKVIAGTHKKLEWKCEEGHIWKAESKSRTYGRGCPTCSSTGFDPNKNGYLYFLIQPNWEIFQIGITNVPEARLSRHKSNGFELLELRGPMDGHTARELETALLKYLKNQKADLSPDHVAGKFDGYSESWTIDSYKVNNLKELIDKASEAGF